ncbi:MAG: hypothetical protein V2J25_15875 [Desulfatiglans sp.]|jgi:hypothetical protein|nr:hypothetical protein [Thermodesulfobacteriota bacterium]MEE4354340.1 hypothetical protein [Desulfatiglans sp.]
MEIIFRKENGHLEAILSGEATYINYSESMVKIHEESLVSSNKSILIDLTKTTGHYNEFDRFKLGEKIASLFGGDYKVVVIDRKERINKFGENTAVNRGALFMVTHDRKVGLDWLNDVLTLYY